MTDISQHPTMLSVSEAARLLNASPRHISELFYRRTLRDDLAPLIAGRRAIPESYLRTIAQELRRANKPVNFGDIQHGGDQ